MDNHRGVQFWEHNSSPLLCSINVLQYLLRKLKLGLLSFSIRYINTGVLNTCYVFVLPWFIGWTPLAPGRASPLGFTFFLDVNKQPIHPAPSPRAALDQDVCDLIFRCCDKFSPAGDAGRILPALLVERSGEHSDGACKARCIDSGESIHLLFTRVNKSLPGLICFCMGKKRHQIFYLLTHIKNRNSPFIIGMIHRLCSAWALHPAKIPSRLNALRVAERNIAMSGIA